MNKTCFLSLFFLCFYCFSSISETNNITYTDLTVKEKTISKIEDLYYLKVSKSVRLTGENLLDYNNFSSLERVRTYTAVKIDF